VLASNIAATPPLNTYTDHVTDVESFYYWTRVRLATPGEPGARQPAGDETDSATLRFGP